MELTSGIGDERRQYFLKVTLTFLVGASFYFTASNFYVGAISIATYNLIFAIVFLACMFIRKNYFLLCMWLTAIFYHAFIFGHAYFLLPGKQIEAGFGLALSLAPVFLRGKTLWVFLITNFALYMIVLQKVNYDTIFIGQYGFFLVTFLVIRTVVNENRRIEEVLKQQAQQIQKDAVAIKEADELKTRFFANITHELRTPLTLILSPLERLIKDSRERNNQLRLLNLIRENAKKLLYRVNELLEFTSLDADETKLKNQSIILLSFIDKIVNLFQPQAESKGIKLRMNSDIAADFIVTMDVSKLEIILVNLLSNAIKFTNHGAIDIDVKVQEKRISFSIHDSGVGIPKDHITKVFNRFHQAPNEDYYEGTGIGLALVKEFVDLMSGSINVESKVGEGTSIFIKLPYVKANKKEETYQLKYQEFKKLKVDKAKTFDRQKPSVFIAEDNDDLRSYLYDILTNDYNVRAFANGREVLEELQKTPQADYPSLILTDLMMPILNGQEMIKAIKNDSSTVGIPIIALTAQTSEQVRIDVFRVGIDDYLTKPFIEEELLTRVGNLVKNDQTKREFINEADEEVSKDLKGFMYQVEKKLLEQVGNSEYQIADLAREMHMGVKSLQLKIKSESGLTPKQYQKAIMLHQARKSILSREVETVSQLALMMGYEDQHYFSTVYKKHFGISPKQEIDRT